MGRIHIHGKYLIILIALIQYNYLLLHGYVIERINNLGQYCLTELILNSERSYYSTFRTKIYVSRANLKCLLSIKCQ